MKEKICCGESLLNNVFTFKYLGHHFQADGDAGHAVEVRMGQARSRFGELHHVWSSSQLSLGLKLRLYIAGVCSMLAHGGEAWLLCPQTVRTLRGWSARCLVIITGRSWREESVDPSVNLIGHLRSRRLRWLGHILRMSEDRMLHRMVCQSVQPYPVGSIFDNAPPHSSMVELMQFASDKSNWRSSVRKTRKLRE